MNQSGGAIRADFHTHSTASDGSLAPEALIRESALRGLSHIALTDHDTTGGLDEALAAGDACGVVVIPGIEFSAHVERGVLHILGYGIDPDDQELQQTIADLRQSRMQRAEKILERLGEIGIDLDPAILAREHEDDSIGRPHIARALVDAGVVSSVSEGFDRFLGWGKPAFVGKKLIHPEDAIRLIRRSGGVAVMAHPYSVPDPGVVIPDLIRMGLVGIECYYGEYDPEQRNRLAAIATEHGLLPTGGSDYHGPAFREGRELGSVEIPISVAAELLEATGFSH